MRTSLLRLALALALTLAVSPSQAEPLRVAVAANFFGPLQKLAVLFEQASGNQLLISSGSSGQLYAQIRQGAPFDVFLSADTDKPQLLESAGLTLPGSRFTYAVGALVLWSAKPGLVDPGGRVLRQQQYHLLAIADPKTAPYGAAAQQVLVRLGLWDALNQQHRLVTGQDITQAWQFAASGNAELAFVALSQVIDAHGHISGSSWRVPQDQYDRIDQAGVILAHTAVRGTAQAFMAWLQRDPAALAAIRAAGYQVGS
jgi:molybdate transport system substrate-binding protein